MFPFFHSLFCTPLMSHRPKSRFCLNSIDQSPATLELCKYEGDTTIYGSVDRTEEVGFINQEDLSTHLSFSLDRHKLGKLLEILEHHRYFTYTIGVHAHGSENLNGKDLCEKDIILNFTVYCDWCKGSVLYISIKGQKDRPRILIFPFYKDKYLWLKKLKYILGIPLFRSNSQALRQKFLRFVYN